MNNIYLIVGLGNIGDQYEGTPHNAGFLFVNSLFHRFQGLNGKVSQWNINKKLEGIVSRYTFTENTLDDINIILLKPSTLMNLSGVSVKKAVEWFNVDPETELIVVYDDLDIALGNFKIIRDKSPRGHKGILSVMNKLGTGDFWHIRIGVDNRVEQKDKLNGEQYVLKKYSLREWKVLEQQVDRAICKMLSASVIGVMNG